MDNSSFYDVTCLIFETLCKVYLFKFAYLPWYKQFCIFSYLLTIKLLSLEMLLVYSSCAPYGHNYPCFIFISLTILPGREGTFGCLLH